MVLPAFYVLIVWYEVIFIATVLPEIRQPFEHSKITPLGDQGLQITSFQLCTHSSRFKLRCRDPWGQPAARCCALLQTRLASAPTPVGASAAGQMPVSGAHLPGLSPTTDAVKTKHNGRERQLLNHKLLLEKQIERLLLQVVPHPGFYSHCLAPNLCQDAVKPHKMVKAQREKNIVD